jgi:hypothetical protein
LHCEPTTDVKCILPFILLGFGVLTACVAPRLRPPTSGNASPIRELWQEPHDIRQRDLFHGVGGADFAPNPKRRFEFLKEDRTGASRGYSVRDDDGTEWDIKLGVEVQPEIVVSRLLWALGYHQPATYYVPAGWQLSNAPGWLSTAVGPQPAARFRRERAKDKVVGEWSWYDNPFIGTRAFKGLVLANFLVSNVDLKTSNNKIYHVDPPIRDATHVFVVRDLGYALGKEAPKLGWLRWRALRGSKNNIDDFEETGFIQRMSADRVEIDYPGLDSGLFDGISSADVRWFCELFARLDDRQLDDAFRAGGYPQHLRARYIRKIKNKISPPLDGRSSGSGPRKPLE